MSKANSKAARITTAGITGLTFPPSRFARHCSHALNASNDEQHSKLEKDLFELKKKDATKPKGPERLKTNHTKAQKTAHEAAIKTHQEALKEYNNYSSKDYKTAELVADTVLKLRQLKDVLTQEGKETKNDKLNASERAAVDHLKVILSDQPVPKRKTESDADFLERKKKFKAPGYSKLVAGADLDDPEAIQARIDKLKDRPNVDLFLQLNDLSGERPRSSGPVYVAIAACAESVAKELVDHALREMQRQKAKTLVPSILVGDMPKLEQLHFWALCRDLPHMRTLIARETRLALYTQEYKNKLKPYKTARKEYLNTHRGQDVPKFKDFEMDGPEEKFEEREVRAGFAIRVVPEGTNKKGEPKRPRYIWKGLDNPDEVKHEEDPDFVHYVRIMCDEKRKELTSYGTTYEHLTEIKISKKFTCFLSDLIVDLTDAISRQLSIRLNPSGDRAKHMKTIKYELVVDVVKQVLTWCHTSLDATQSALLTSMSDAAKALKEHKTAKNPKAAADKDEDEDENENENENENEDEAESEAAKPAESAKGAASPAKPAQSPNGKPAAAEDSDEDSDEETPISRSASPSVRGKPPARTVARK